VSDYLAFCVLAVCAPLPLLLVIRAGGWFFRNVL
jgi:hypothetical protein